MEQPLSPEQQFLRLAPTAMVRSVRAGMPSWHLSFAQRVRILFMLGRPRTWVPNLLAFGLGYSYTGAPVSVRMLAGAILSCCIGFSANIHNAAVELDEDSENLPGRVLLVSKFGHRRLLLYWRVLVSLMMLTAVALGAYFSVFMALAIVGLHQYSAPPVRSKGRPILGLWVFAQAVVVPFLFGWTTAPGRLLETLIEALLAHFRGLAPPAEELSHPSFRYLGMWAFLTLWFMAKGAFKNVPDFAGDKAASVLTSATLFSSQRRAALATAIATLLAYSSLSVLVALKLERSNVLLALVWLLPVAGNCTRLVRAKDAAQANLVLKQDMWLSTGFLASLVLLVQPNEASLLIVAAGAILLFGSDALGLDSRRPTDLRRFAEPKRVSVGN